MKTIRLLTLSLALAGLTTTVFAKGEPASADLQLRKKIVSLISDVDLTPMEHYEQDATIKFLITGENEIVVLSVHTASDYIDSLVKERLNYNHVRVHGIKKMTPYSLSVRFVKES
ncbi:MAG: hypothetical protein R3301_17325 [Saprospiraceae bacterium]|nr:hypothetical protein [Saprospiraceae bacterium]